MIPYVIVFALGCVSGAAAYHYRAKIVASAYALAARVGEKLGL